MACKGRGSIKVKGHYRKSTKRGGKRVWVACYKRVKRRGK